jgi:Domain of unknown function (DUF5658)
MSALTKSILLFVLNWLDGQLTIFWVRAEVATEGNSLMGQLLKLGDGPFLFSKLVIGAFASYVLFRCAHRPLARRGMQLVLTVYCGLMFAHAATGLAMLGWHGPEAVFSYVGNLPHAVLALFS